MTIASFSMEQDISSEIPGWEGLCNESGMYEQQGVCGMDGFSPT